MLQASPLQVGAIAEWTASQVRYNTDKSIKTDMMIIYLKTDLDELLM